MSAALVYLYHQYRRGWLRTYWRTAHRPHMYHRRVGCRGLGMALYPHFLVQSTWKSLNGAKGHAVRRILADFGTNSVANKSVRPERLHKQALLHTKLLRRPSSVLVAAHGQWLPWHAPH